MKFGICMQAVVSVHELPSWKSRMINQLLFGELFTIKDEKDDWLLIETADDHFEGWIYRIEATQTDESFYTDAVNSAKHFFYSLSGRIKGEKLMIPVTKGAQFPFWKDGTFKINNHTFYYYKSVHPVPDKVTYGSITDVAKSYLGTSFLCGGRSPFGIDGPGLIQIAFKMNGIGLPRSAAKQMEHGEQILFVEAAKQGDLAFFEDDEGNINHSGIILDQNKIIHAWGKVRIDTIDHVGIFNAEMKKYTHKLRVVKRVLAE